MCTSLSRQVLCSCWRSFLCLFTYLLFIYWNPTAFCKERNNSKDALVYYDYYIVFLFGFLHRMLPRMERDSCTFSSWAYSKSLRGLWGTARVQQETCFSSQTCFCPALTWRCSQQVQFSLYNLFLWAERAIMSYLVFALFIVMKEKLLNLPTEGVPVSLLRF